MAHKNLVVLLLSLLVISTACRQLRGAEADYATDHQRILAELEEVHQLRERMLQQGKACSWVRHDYWAELSSSCTSQEHGTAQ